MLRALVRHAAPLKPQCPGLAVARRALWTLPLDQREGGMSIEAMDEYGFTVNGIQMRGPVIVFPEFCLLWNVPSIQEATVEAFTPVWCLKPNVGESFASLSLPC